jgi:uncharacterized protein YebE (UPF0316 family)
MFNFVVPPMTAELFAAVLAIFLLRIIGVALATVRTLIMMRGRKLLSALMGFFEVTIYVLAVGPVVNDLDNLWNLLGYGLGFSVGTLVGMLLEERLALGFATVRIMSREKSQAIAKALHEAGHGATLSWGWGREGSVRMVTATVRRKEVKPVTLLVEKIDAEAFITAEEAYAIRRGYMRIARHER